MGNKWIFTVALSVAVMEVQAVRPWEEMGSALEEETEAQWLYRLFEDFGDPVLDDWPKAQEQVLKISEEASLLELFPLSAQINLEPQEKAEKEKAPPLARKKRKKGEGGFQSKLKTSKYDPTLKVSFVQRVLEEKAKEPPSKITKIIADVALELNIPYGTGRDWVSRYNERTIGSMGGKWEYSGKGAKSRKIVLEIFADYDQSLASGRPLTQMALAKKHGVSASIVSQWLRKRNHGFFRALEISASLPRFDILNKT